MDDSTKLLAELLRAKLAKDPILAAKQRRLLEKLGAAQVDELDMKHQQRMADAVAAKLAAMRGDSES
jgi:hypothetical protein